MVLITRRWRTPAWIFWATSILELLLIVPTLALFAIAQPDLYRSDLQRFGADRGWNSDPDQQLYAQANGRTYHPPLCWSTFITGFNVVISIISLFFLLAKTTFYMLHIYVPILSIITHIPLVIMYAYSVYGQASPDKSDPEHIQSGAPWFLTKGCGVVSDGSLRNSCRQAVGCFVLTVILLGIYVFFMGISIYSMWPSQAELEKYRNHKAEVEELRNYHKSVLTEDMQWQLHNMPTPGLPPMTAGGTAVTPRTNAFNLLNGMRSPKPALPITAAMIANRQRPTTTVVIPQGPAVPIHMPTPLTSSPPTSTPGSGGSPYKSDLPFRNLG